MVAECPGRCDPVPVSPDAETGVAEDPLQQGFPFTPAQIMGRFREATGLSLVAGSPSDLRHLGLSRTLSLDPDPEGTDRFGVFRFLVEIDPPDRRPWIGIAYGERDGAGPSWYEVFPERSHDAPFWSVTRYRGNVRLDVSAPEKHDVEERYRILNAVLKSLKTGSR
jgi:hypothetical protein